MGNRGDMLIWSLIFIRAFGMGPFSGILAIGVTDTGTLGKLMSESIENIDKKEMEGVKSTGANSLQQNRLAFFLRYYPYLFRKHCTIWNLTHVALS